MTRQEFAERAEIANSALPQMTVEYYIYIGMLVPMWMYIFRRLAYLVEDVRERKFLAAIGDLLYFIAELMPGSPDYLGEWSEWTEKNIREAPE